MLILLVLIKRVIHEECDGVWCVKEGRCKSLINYGARSCHLLELTLSKAAWVLLHIHMLEIRGVLLSNYAILL